VPTRGELSRLPGTPGIPGHRIAALASFEERSAPPERYKEGERKGKMER